MYKRKKACEKYKEKINKVIFKNKLELWEIFPNF